MSKLNNRWETSNETNRFREEIINTVSKSMSYDKSERTRFSAGGFGVDAPNWKVAVEIAVCLLVCVGGVVWWKSNRKKSEDDNKSNNKIKVDNNKSENKIKENKEKCNNDIMKSGAITDDKIRVATAISQLKREEEREKHANKMEELKVKSSFKNGKNIIPPDLTTHPLLAPTKQEGVISHCINYFTSNNIVKARDLYCGLIFENNTVEIFSQTNTGKSLFTLAFTTQICMENRDIRGVYYNTEMDDSQLQRLLGKGNKYSDNIEVVSKGIDTAESLIGNMILNIEKYRKHIVFVIDNLTYYYSTRSGDKIKEFIELIKLIRDNAKQQYGINITVIIVTHADKNNEGKPLTLASVKDGGCGNCFVDTIIGLGQVNGYEYLRYVKLLKSREANKSLNVMVFKIVDSNPRIQYLGEAKEKEVLSGKYISPEKMPCEDHGEFWYNENQAGKGYGTIAREYYNLSEIDRQNDDEKTKAQKKKKFEKLRNHVRNTIEAYKKKQLKQTA